MRTRTWLTAAVAGVALLGCEEPGSPPADEVHGDQQMPPDELGDEAPDHPEGAESGD
ncbi:hypothetical protein [Egicoccus sp. AB-alg2]|uniref:hypothetical protein n=1 Tax=Egicoccus sp. AB-alg2 TaxID=3242693 RepID=UPI00359E0E94